MPCAIQLRRKKYLYEKSFLVKHESLNTKKNYSKFYNFVTILLKSTFKAEQSQWTAHDRRESDTILDENGQQVRWVALRNVTTIRTGGEEDRYWPGKLVPPLLLTQHPPICSGVNTPISYWKENSLSLGLFYAIYIVSLASYSILVLTGIPFRSHL